MATLPGCSPNVPDLRGALAGGPRCRCPAADRRLVRRAPELAAGSAAQRVRLEDRQRAAGADDARSDRQGLLPQGRHQAAVEHRAGGRRGEPQRPLLALLPADALQVVPAGDRSAGGGDRRRGRRPARGRRHRGRGGHPGLTGRQGGAASRGHHHRGRLQVAEGHDGRRGIEADPRRCGHARNADDPRAAGSPGP